MKFFEDLAPEVQSTIVDKLTKKIRNATGLKGSRLHEAVDDYINCNNTPEKVTQWVNTYYL